MNLLIGEFINYARYKLKREHGGHRHELDRGVHTTLTADWTGFTDPRCFSDLFCSLLGRPTYIESLLFCCCPLWHPDSKLWTEFVQVTYTFRPPIA